MALSSFTPSVTGLEAQSQALGTVSTNIANMSTVGYRAVNTEFQTLLGRTPSTGNTKVGDATSRVGINGVRAYDRTQITRQGNITPTGENYDVALDVNNGFFMVQDSGGKIYYTRAGNFTLRTDNGETYLIANNGYNVDGFKAIKNGEFEASTSPIIIDAPGISPSVPTTKVDISANVPATGVDTSTYSFQVYGANNDGNLVNMVFRKDETTNNLWHVLFDMPNGTVAGGGVDVKFSSDGKLISPETIDITVTADNGDVNNVTVNISEMTQYAGDDTIVNVSQDGKASSMLARTYINNYGVVQAQYANGELIDIAKLAVVAFTAPENLIQENGTMFVTSNEVGDSYYLIGHDTVSSSVLTSQAVESSPVNLEQEFSNLIIVQRAYSLNTSSFTANNEMLQTAVNILS